MLSPFLFTFYQHLTYIYTVSDILMPIMDGFQFCRECKTHPEWAKIPFIFYSATYTEKKDEEFAIALGAERFLIKPQEPEMFLKVIKEVLDLSRDRVEAISKNSSADGASYLSKYNERVVRKLDKKVADLAKINLTLRESEEKYRLVVDNAAEAILIAQDGMIRFANPGGYELFGYTEEILTSKPFTEFIHPEDCEMVLEHHQKRLNGEDVPAVYPFRVIAGDGTVKWVEIKSVMIPWKDRPATLNFLSDITQRKLVEDELKRTLDGLKNAVAVTIQVLMSAVESRDPYTAGHQLRVADLAVAIASEMELSQDTIEGIRMAGSIHDVGKLSIPAEILSKPIKLTDLEFSIIKEHAQSGYEMLKDVKSPWPLAQIVYQHHERMDGYGYPRNLKGDEIILEARIMAVADVVEAMASHRPYRPALGIEDALEDIEKNKGVLYDEKVVDACLKLFREKGYQLK